MLLFRQRDRGDTASGHAEKYRWQRIRELPRPEDRLRCGELRDGRPEKRGKCHGCAAEVMTGLLDD